MPAQARKQLPQKPLASTERAARLAAFIGWSRATISGDEKGEAQIFLDRLFQAFGWPGLPEAGAKCEVRVKNDTGGTSFADLVWKPRVVIEMKKRDADLSKHLRQAFNYWSRLVPGRPRYAVLCNFDEFWVYDFETQMDTPVDIVRLEDLASRFGALAFLFPEDEKPVFGKDQEAVTRKAADRLSTCFNSLIARRIEREAAQRFVLQSLMALFAEDIGLLEKYQFTRLLDDCKIAADSFDLLGGLFEAMNTPGGTAGGRYKGVQYFNGGLFAKPARVELTTEELNLLSEAAKYDWSQVRPEIFGALFEHSLGKKERHAFGAHFTNAADIMKIVGPTIVEPWSSAIESAKTLKELRTLLTRIENFRVLDPACGSGNFLYIAYRELKRLEARIYERMSDEFKSVNPAQRPFGFVTTRNFHGIDVTPFAIEIAKVTMMLGRKLAIDEFHITERPLPLDNLDTNFRTGDALILQDGSPAPWPKADVIIGNPPFLGAKRLKPERGIAYVDAVRAAYPDVPGMADYCVYWLRRAHDALPSCTAENPLAGRAGLVGTQNIRHNKSRIGGLDHIVTSGTIVEAVDNQPWSGEANVNVSIVNWVKTKAPGLVPRIRRLWFNTDNSLPRTKSQSRAPLDLDFRECSFINSNLSDATNVCGAVRLATNQEPQCAFQGVTPGHAGFVLRPGDRTRLLQRDSNSGEVIFPYLIGRELVGGTEEVKRFVIDFGTRSMLQAQAYSSAFEQVRDTVLSARQKKADEGRGKDGEYQEEHRQALERWWRLWRDREEMKVAIRRLKNRYIAGSRTQRRPFIFCFVSKDILAGDKLQTFAFDDDYSFGILQAAPHLEWYAAKGARLKNEKDYNYSTESVFETYPWPQQASRADIDKVAKAARELRRVRREALAVKGGLRGLYSTLSLPGANPLKDAHRDLDDAVLAAYGFSRRKDLLGQVLGLNLAVAELVESGKPVTPPGVPVGYPDPARLRTEDCWGAPAS